MTPETAQEAQAAMGYGEQWYSRGKHPLDGRPVNCLWTSLGGRAAGAQEVQEIADVIREEYPDRLGFAFPLAPAEILIAFNDHLDTVYSEVVSVLEKAVTR